MINYHVNANTMTMNKYKCIFLRIVFNKKNPKTSTSRDVGKGTFFQCW